MYRSVMQYRWLILLCRPAVLVKDCITGLDFRRDLVETMVPYSNDGAELI